MILKVGNSGITSSREFRSGGLRPLGSAIDPDGNLILAGTTNSSSFGGGGFGPLPDLYLQKIDGRTGLRLWAKQYDNSHRSPDHFSKLLLDPMGDCIILGYADVSSTRDALAVKLSGLDGHLLWEHMFAGSSNGDDYYFDGGIEPNGDVIVCGSTYIGSTRRPNILMEKLSNLSGAALWTNTLADTSYGIYGVAMAVDPNGDAIILGSTDNNIRSKGLKCRGNDGSVVWSCTFPFGSSGRGRFVLLINSQSAVFVGSSAVFAGQEVVLMCVSLVNGAGVWRKDISRQNQVLDGQSLVQLNGNSVLSASDGFGGYLVTCINSAGGRTVWQQQFPGPNLETYYVRPACLSVVNNNTLYMGSTVSVTSQSDDIDTKQLDITNGAPIWEKQVDTLTSRNESLRAIASDHAGGVVVSGQSYGSVVTLAYDVDGNLLWRNDHSTDDGQVNKLLVDGHGDIYLYGSRRFGTGREMMLLKFRGPTGEVVFDLEPGGLFAGKGFIDAPVDLILDHDDNLIVLGKLQAKLLVRKINRNGDLLWQSVIGYGTSEINPAAIAVSSSGDIAVTGFISAASAPMITSRLSGANGAVRWSKAYHSRYDRNDFPAALQFDRDDNIYVASSSGIDGTYDWLVQRYDALDGNISWSRRFNGAGNRNDYAKFISITASGNVIVTGNTTNTSFGIEGGILALESSTGAVRWSQSAPVDPTDSKLDELGNVFLAGTSTREGNVRMSYVQKTRITDGSQEWSLSFEPDGDIFRSAVLIALGSGGRLYSGISNPENTGTYDYIVKAWDGR